jgi:hypothetical protein
LKSRRAALPRARWRLRLCSEKARAPSLADGQGHPWALDEFAHQSTADPFD